MEVSQDLGRWGAVTSDLGIAAGSDGREAVFISDDVLELGVEEDVLDLEVAEGVHALTRDSAVGLTHSTSLDRKEFQTILAWTKLRNGADLPFIEDARVKAGALFTPLTVVFDLALGLDSPVVSYLGDDLSNLSDLDRDWHCSKSRTNDDLISRLYEKCSDAIAAREPIDFDVSWREFSGRLRSTRGLVLPFAGGDARVGHLLAILAVPTDTAEKAALGVDGPIANEDVLLLYQEIDPSSGPRSVAPTAGEPFILVSLPGSDRMMRPDRSLDRPLPLVAQYKNTRPIVKPAFGSLAKCLEQARNLAEAVKACDVRSHGALYDAISCAYDLAVAARQAPDELAQLMSAAHIAMQQRAPMTPIVKLVFNSDYDKTRLAEYATALSHAHRIGLGRGAFAPFLRAAEGGLKGVVREERRLRRAGNDGLKRVRTGPSDRLARKLRAMSTLPLAEFSGDGDEFVLVLARRLSDGRAVMIGEVPRDIPLLERAARRLAAGQG